MRKAKDKTVTLWVYGDTSVEPVEATLTEGGFKIDDAPFCFADDEVTDPVTGVKFIDYMSLWICQSEVDALLLLAAGLRDLDEDSTAREITLLANAQIRIEELLKQKEPPTYTANRLRGLID